MSQSLQSRQAPGAHDNDACCEMSPRGKAGCRQAGRPCFRRPTTAGRRRCAPILATYMRAEGSLLAFDLHSHHALATTFAGEKSDQGRGRVLKSVDDILLNLQLPGLDPCAQIDDRAVALAEVVHDDEAAWIPERSATCLREADLNVLSKLGNQGLEGRLEPEAFTGGEVGREDDLLDFLVGCPVYI